MTTFAEIAYNAYGEARDWKVVGGTPMPRWNEQSEDLQKAWAEASRAVIGWLEEPLRPGVYEHDGNYYLFLSLCRMHNSCDPSNPATSELGDEFVAYIPLRVEPEWSGTARTALRPLAEFMEKFAWVGLRLPNDI